MIFALGESVPELNSDETWVAPTASVIGNVDLQANSSVWFGAVIRGDNERITVGQGSNVQENVVIHTDPGFPVKIGKNCTIGHSAIIHGCVIDEQSLIGMGATILNGAKIGKNCLIGAGALVTEGKEVPDGSLVIGRPAKVVRTLDEETIHSLLKSAETYQKNAERFRNHLKQV